MSIVAIICIFTAAISYQHEYELAHGNGQAQWVAALVPFSVDGIVLVSGVALLWAAGNSVKGFTRLWRPMAWLVVGVLATIAANFLSDLHFWWLGPAVSASSGVALILVSDVAFWLLAASRQVARGEVPQRGRNCSCPPPPVSLAEALPLAKAELEERGENHGQEKLADRFRVSVHQVRLVLAEPSQNGSAPHA